MPDPMVTNMCFTGDDHRTAYITMSGRRLAGRDHLAPARPALDLLRWPTSPTSSRPEPTTPTTPSASVRSRGEPTQTWTWAEYVVECRARAALLEDLRRDGPFHVGVLLDNVPEFPMWLGGAALAGATLVGINPTRRGAELARDIRHTDCQLIVTEPAHRPLLDGLDLGLDDDRVLDVESDAYAELVEPTTGARRSVAPDVDDATCSCCSSPRARPARRRPCICSQGRLARAGIGLTSGFQLGAERLRLPGDAAVPLERAVRGLVARGRRRA